MTAEGGCLRLKLYEIKETLSPMTLLLVLKTKKTTIAASEALCLQKQKNKVHRTGCNASW